MQFAALLSDLNSLSVCPPEAALNLVSVHRTLSGQDDQSAAAAQSQLSNSSPDNQSVDRDLQRANELISLHYNVKLQHMNKGLDEELVEARRDVNRVLMALER